MTQLEALKKYFGYDSFREGQAPLVEGILAGRDALGIMPTGAGKSLCYQIPALLLPGITLVVSPLLSLMKDQVTTLNQAGIHAAYLNSSLSPSGRKSILRLLQRYPHPPAPADHESSRRPGISLNLPGSISHRAVNRYFPGDSGRETTFDKGRQRAACSSKERHKKSPAGDYGDIDRSLFEKLRTLRLDIARAEKVPPYIVFSDKTLVQMCILKPQTKEEMLQVSGVGEMKYTKYGEKFLEIVQKSP